MPVYLETFIFQLNLLDKNTCCGYKRNFALPGVMLKFERGQYCRKKKKEKKLERKLLPEIWLGRKICPRFLSSSTQIHV